MGAVLDSNNNNILAVSQTNAVTTSTVNPDITPPVLLNFVLNFATAMIDLQFTEVVDESTLNISSITLRNTLNISNENH